MAQDARPALASEAGVDAFTQLVVRYLDGDLDPAEIAELKRLLAEAANHRESFVRACRLHGALHEAFAARRAQRQAAQTGDPRADTIFQEPSAEDTLYPPPKPPPA